MMPRVAALRQRLQFVHPDMSAGEIFNCLAERTPGPRAVAALFDKKPGKIRWL